MVIEIDGSQPPSLSSIHALSALFDRADIEPETPVAIRTGGTPPADWAHCLDISLVTKWERAVRRLEQLPVITIALATGDCGGTALDVLLATDLRIATPDTRLLVHRGKEAVWPGMSGYRLVQQAGAASTRRALLFGQPIDATQALALGLLDDVGDDLAAMLASAVRLAGGSFGPETAIQRRLMLDAATTSFEESLGAHLAACDRALRRLTTPVAP